MRYYTGIGVLRADLATPLNPRPDDSLGRALHRHRAGVLKRLLAALGLLVLVAIAALAQEASTDSAGDNGFLINLLENRSPRPAGRSG